MESHETHRFGDQLKACRKLAEMSQEELALAVGLEGGSSISRYEKGLDTPTKERLDAIINKFREKGVAQEQLENLIAQSQYGNPTPADHRLRRAGSILEGQHPETIWLLDGVMNEVLEPLEKYQIALTDMRRGENEEAQIILDRLLPGSLKSLDFHERLRLKLLISSAEVRRLQGEFVGALDILKEAETIAAKLGENGLEMFASVLKIEGNIYRRLSKWAEAKDAFNGAIKAYRDYEYHSRSKLDAIIANLERKLAGTHLFQGQPKGAMKHIQRSIAICDTLGDMAGRIQGMQHQAWAIALLGNISEALKIHKGIVQDFEILKPHEVTIAKGYRYLGDSYRMCGMPNKAIDAYTTAVDHLDRFYSGKAEAKDVLVYGTINLGLGASYRALDDHRGAEKYLRQSLELHVGMGARHYEALARRELGKMLLDADDFPNAEQELSKAQRIFQDLDNVYYLIGLSRDLADLEYKRGRFPEARAHAIASMKQAEKAGFSARLVTAQLTLAKINLADPDAIGPFTLYTSALQLAIKLDPYLVYEVLCHATEQPYRLKNEISLKSETLRLCDVALTKGHELEKSTAASKDGIGNWLEEIEHLQNRLENELKACEFSNGRAVIVGVANYRNMGALEKTIIDAQDLRDLLEQSGYPSLNISLLLDKQATKKNINKALANLARDAKPADTVLFFFSGHGEHHVGGFEPGDYLCPVEADRDELRATAISNDELTTAISLIPANQVVVLLDACHSGGVGEPKNSGTGIKAGLSDSAYTRLAMGEGRVVIASSKPNEYSYEIHGWRNGLFSHFLLRGLEGNAADKDGAIRILELFKYISENVPKHKPQQHPLLKTATIYDFPIVRMES